MGGILYFYFLVIKSIMVPPPKWTNATLGSNKPLVTYFLIIQVIPWKNLKKQTFNTFWALPEWFLEFASAALMMDWVSRLSENVKYGPASCRSAIQVIHFNRSLYQIHFLPHSHPNHQSRHQALPFWKFHEKVK